MVNALGAGLVGAPETIAERLRRYEAIGLDCVMLRFTPMLEGVETFGTKVMPLLRGGTTGSAAGRAAARAWVAFEDDKLP